MLKFKKTLEAILTRHNKSGCKRKCQGQDFSEHAELSVADPGSAKRKCSDVHQSNVSLQTVSGAQDSALSCYQFTATQDVIMASTSHQQLGQPTCAPSTSANISQASVTATAADGSETASVYSCTNIAGPSHNVSSQQTLTREEEINIIKEQMLAGYKGHLPLH